ncbi:MAG: hypothetical protein V1886_00690 [archaeon]
MIIHKEGKIILELSKDLYSNESIEKAIKDFGIEGTKKTESKTSISILLSDKEQALEFCNYCLGLEKIKMDNLSGSKNGA